MRRSSYDHHGELERREKEKRRREWMIQREKDREHERLKRKKIEEYEKKRAELLELSLKRRSPHRSHGISEEPQHESRLKFHNGSDQVMSQKLDSSEGNEPFFKGPTGILKYNDDELRQVTVRICRKITEPAASTNEIKRDVVNPGEIQLKRREGEGSKPIFDREELKKIDDSEDSVEERRVIKAVTKSSHGTKPRLKRRSASLSPRPHTRRSPSPIPRVSSDSHRSRSDAHIRYHPEDHHHRGHHHHKDPKAERYYSDKRSRSREDSSRHRTSSRVRSLSRERHHHRGDYEHSRSSRSYRSRSNDRFHGHRDRRESSRERRTPPPLPPPQYGQVPYPFFYGHFPPRPVLIGPPIPPIRPPMMGGRPMVPGRPLFPHRFIGPQDMYRNVPDTRYNGRMY